MLLFGKPVAEKILSETKEKMIASGIIPGLAVVFVGDDDGSNIYVGIKEKRAKEIGMHFEVHRFEKTASESDITGCIRDLNGRDDIHGIIVQLPLPPGISADRIIAAIDPMKDADGFLGTDGRTPVFPEAMIELAKSSGVPLSGRQAAAFVHSERFGRAMTDALRREGVVAEYIFPDDIGASRYLVGQADFVFSAMGRPGALSESMFKRGAVVIDGGIFKQGEKVVGDVEPLEMDTDIFLSPVPGGVGPVTVACLLRRVVELALADNKKSAS